MLPNQEEWQKRSNTSNRSMGKGVEDLKLVINIPVNILYSNDVIAMGNKSDWWIIKSQGQPCITLNSEGTIILLDYLRLLQDTACRKKDHTILRKLIMNHTKCRRLIMDHPKCRRLIIDHPKCRI